MPRNKENMSFEEIRRILGSVGITFPGSSMEIHVFNKLYSNYKYEISPESIDPEKIYNNTFNRSSIKVSDKHPRQSISLKKTVDGWKMAARNKESSVPEDILQKMKKNHEKKSKPGSSSQEEND